jgi:hypothetical protein
MSAALIFAHPPGCEIGFAGTGERTPSRLSTCSVNWRSRRALETANINCGKASARGTSDEPLLSSHIRQMWIGVKLINAFRVERRRTAFEAVYDVALLEQELGEISTILSSHSGNEHHFSNQRNGTITRELLFGSFRTNRVRCRTSHVIPQR